MTREAIEHKLRTAGEAYLGRFAEQVWENIFRKSGIGFIPLARIETGGAPMVEAKSKIILPDYDCATPEWNAYIDSKCKSGPVLYRIRNQWRHGINRNNYNDYLKTADLFNKKAGLAIIELFDDEATKVNWSGALLVETFKELGTPIQGESSQRHMVYWPRKQFVDMDSLTPEELVDAFNGKPPRSYSVELQEIFARKTQAALFGESA